MSNAIATKQQLSMMAWDSVPNCNTQHCPVVTRCKHSNEGKKCSVQGKYVEHFFTSVFATFGDKTDDLVKFKIGVQIVPLYCNLMRMYITEMSLNDPFYITEKGTIITHPVYREIRETLRTLTTMWRDLEMTWDFKSKPGLNDLEDFDGIANGGDPEYHRKMSIASSRTGVIR